MDNSSESPEIYRDADHRIITGLTRSPIETC